MPLLTPTEKATATLFLAIILGFLGVTGKGLPFTAAGSSLLFIVLAVAYAHARREAAALFGLKVRRIHSERAVEGLRMEVKITVENPTPKALSYVEVIDHAPIRARPHEAVGRIPVPASGSAVFTYTITPAPGYHRFKRVTLLTGDPLGLFHTSRDIPLLTGLSVEPISLGELLFRGVSGGRAEPLVSRMRGWGTELYHLREYEPGDDVRRIAWLATARTGRLIVWDGVREAAEDYAILADLSAESWAGTPGETAADWIMRAVLTVSKGVTLSGGRVWVTILRGDVWEDLGPLRGRDAVDMLRARLSMAGPSTVSPRSTLARSTEDLLARAPISSVKIFMIGPTADLASLAETISRIPQGRCRSIVAIFHPSGETAIEEVVRRADHRLIREGITHLRRLGIGVAVVDSPSKLVWLLEEAARYAFGQTRPCL
ncbi:MAG: DUF58 domain-containing protein [Desulfurococcales archaeon]|nr:DUF58 domain-containing protein [Desulfurococcales archaeon]